MCQARPPGGGVTHGDYVASRGAVRAQADRTVPRVGNGDFALKDAEGLLIMSACAESREGIVEGVGGGIEEVGTWSQRCSSVGDQPSLLARQVRRWNRPNPEYCRNAQPMI